MSEARERGQHILVVRLAGIGDVAVSSALIARIRAERPDARITFLTGKAAAPLARLFDGVEEVLEVDERALFHGSLPARIAMIFGLWRQLIARRYDRVLLLHVDARYRVITLPLVGARVDQLSRARHGEMIPVPARWLGDEYARLLDGNAHVGPIERRYGMVDLRPRLAVASIPRDRPRAVIVPGGARNVLRDDALRRWPVAHYADLARRLIDAGVEVVLSGSESDRWVVPAFEGLALRNEIGTKDLVDTLAALADADVVVSHDTGPLHFARLVRTPVVALFGPTIPRQVLWTDDSVTVIWGGEHLACRPCFDGREFARCANNVCLSSVSPAEVHEAVRATLTRAAERTPVPSL